MLVALITILILVLAIGTTLISTTNKYFTAYQWASWQEALQGAESGADMAMAEMRKDVASTFSSTPSSTPWVGWSVGKYKLVGGVKTPQKDPATYKPIGTDGKFSNNSGGGGGNLTTFNINFLRTNTDGWDFVTYSTNLTAHAGEGNTSLRISATMDTPSSLTDPSGTRWVRVRATGTTDLAGPVRASEEKLDNRLRKLGLFFDKVLNQSTVTDSTAKKETTRQIELVAKPVSLFAGAITTMVQFKDDGGATVSDSFNSEDKTNWPVNISTGEIDLAVSHDPTNPLGKNGDIASNAFPIKHDHSENLDIKGDTIWGDVGNNYSQIKGIDPNYYGQTPDPTDYGLNNGNFGTVNPTPKLIKTDGTGDISGNIATNYYRDLPPVVTPSWSSGSGTGNANFIASITKIDKNTADITASTDKANPTRIVASSLTLSGGDKWTLKAPAVAKGWTTSTPPVVGYVEIYVTGNIKLDDGGTVVIQSVEDGATGIQKSYVQARIYFDHDLKIGETKETKTNAGGFDTQSDDAKDLLLFGITQPDAGKMPKDNYLDPLGNDSLYTPYKASGNIVFKENDFTGAIYAPDHNIVFDNSKDGKGKRHKRKQTGADFYGSYVGRTIHSKKAHNYHFDESLNDAGPALDWGYVSWFEDVDVDNR